MRAALFALSAAAFAASQAPAQDGGPTADRVLGGTVAELTDRLDLDGRQADKIKEIHERTEEGLKMIREAGRMREMRNLRVAAQRAVREQLTEEQKTRYDQLLRSGSEDRPRGGDVSMGQLRRELNLDEGQTRGIEAIRSEAEEERRRIREERRLSGDREAERARREELDRRTNDRIRNLLDDEQRKKFDDLVAPAGSNARDRGGRRSPAQRAAELVSDLGVEEDRAPSVTEALTKVLEIQRALDEELRPLQRQLRDVARNRAASEDAVAAKLEELRARRAELDRGLAEAEAAVRELLTMTQEAQLVSEGALR
jgi:Spy/CpxP family protein refolding chaperone